MAQPEDRIIVALLAIVIGYAVWGAVLARSRLRR
jgi:hypothetical protein